jgi:hypothetical protein
MVFSGEGKAQSSSHFFQAHISIFSGKFHEASPTQVNKQSTQSLQRNKKQDNICIYNFKTFNFQWQENCFQALFGLLFMYDVDIWETPEIAFVCIRRNEYFSCYLSFFNGGVALAEGQFTYQMVFEGRGYFVGISVENREK